MDRKETYAYKRKVGICTQCSAPAIPGRAMCAKCVELKHQKNKRYWAKHSEEIKAKRRQHKEEAEANGMCSCCGERPPVKGGKMCKQCRVKKGHKPLPYYETKYWRRENGICERVDCGKPVVQGYCYCAEHLAVKREIALRMGQKKAGEEHPWKRMTVK